MEPYFIHCEIHHGQLIGIEERKGYQFYLFSYGGNCSPEQRTHYSTLRTQFTRQINSAVLSSMVAAWHASRVAQS